MTCRRSEAARRRVGGEAGFGLVEVVIAIVVLVMASVAAIGVIAASARSELTTRQGDQGLLVASAAMENAAAYDCGSTTAAPASGGVVDTNLLDLRIQRCRALGDVTWPESDGVLNFTVALSTSWVPFNPDKSTTLTRDNLRLRREVDVTWTRGGRTRHRHLVSLAAIPPDSLAVSNPASVTVKVAANATAALEIAPASTGHPAYVVQHSADQNGFVRFPFLEFGTYTLLVNGVPSGAVSPSATAPDVKVGF